MSTLTERDLEVAHKKMLNSVASKVLDYMLSLNDDFQMSAIDLVYVTTKVNVKVLNVISTAGVVPSLQANYELLVEKEAHDTPKTF